MPRKIPGGAAQAGQGPGVFAAEIRAAPGWVTSSGSVPPCGDDGRRDCRALRHTLPDPASNGERQKPLRNDLLGTRTSVGSETKRCCACATDVSGPWPRHLHSQPESVGLGAEEGMPLPLADRR